MSTFMYSYNEYSIGARELSRGLGIKRIAHHNSAFKGSENKTVINWGAKEVPDEISKSRVINPPKNLASTINKLTFFELMKKHGFKNIPDFTTDVKVALDWVKKGLVPVGRAKLESKSGAGIYFLGDGQEFIEPWSNCRLWTLYIKKKDEYRVHIVEGELVDVQKKVLRQHDEQGNPIDPKTVDFRVRNLANGFIFQRENITVPDKVIQAAKDCFKITELNFGAFDVIFNQSINKAFVLEVNSAPGIMGTTLENYVSHMKRYL